MIYVIIKTEGKYSDRTTKNIFGSSNKEIAYNTLNELIAKQIIINNVSKQYNKELLDFMNHNPAPQFAPFYSVSNLPQPRTKEEHKEYKTRKDQYLVEAESARKAYSSKIERFRQNFLKQNNLPENTNLQYDEANYYIDEVPSDLSIFT